MRDQLTLRPMWLSLPIYKSRLDSRNLIRDRKTIKTIYLSSQCKMTMAMVVALETPHRVLMLDPTCTDLLLYSPEEIAGRSINIFSGPKTDLNKIHTAIKGSSFRSATTIDVVLYERCGEPRNIVFSCSAFLGTTGNLHGCRIVMEASENRHRNDGEPVGLNIHWRQQGNEYYSHHQVFGRFHIAVKNDKILGSVPLCSVSRAPPE